MRTDLNRNRLVPFLGVAEHRINVEHDPAKREQAVPHHLTDLKFGASKFVHGGSETTQLWRVAGDLAARSRRFIAWIIAPYSP
jgi:hypothetical protein